MTGQQDLDTYRRPGSFIDSDAPGVVDFSRRVCGEADDEVGKAVGLYGAVRDGIVYTPYLDFHAPDTYRASAVLASGAGFCIGKAALLAAAARAAGLAARVGFADVRNHLCTPRLRALMGTDVFVYHGYAELHLEGRWVKATPAFDRALCERFGVHALEFDGRHDSLLQPHDRAGRRHMEYVLDRGPYADVPVPDIVAAFEHEYPSMMRAGAAVRAPAMQFRAEAEPARDR